MKRMRKVFCTLLCPMNIDGCFIPKGTKVQLVQQVDLVATNGNSCKKIRVLCCDYLSDAFHLRENGSTTDYSHATSGSPIFFDVDSSWLEYDSSVVAESENPFMSAQEWELVKKLRNKGLAVAIVTPDQFNGADRQDIENVMVKAGDLFSKNVEKAFNEKQKKEDANEVYMENLLAELWRNHSSKK